MPLLLAAEEPPADPTAALTALTARALAWQPTVQAAREEVAAATARLRATDGFYDPRLQAATGAADELATIPGQATVYGLADTATVVQGGIEKAMPGGWYVGVGAAERYVWGADPDDDDNIYQSVVGAQVRLPLWRDRGFRTQDLLIAQRLAERHAAEGHLRDAVETVTHDVELAWVDLLEAAAVVAVAEDATARVRALESEARELARLKVVAEYQILAATMEVALREEEELAARETLAVQRDRLAQLTGAPAADVTPTLPPAFVAWAAAATIPPAPETAILLPRRGAWRAADSLVAAADWALAAAREDLKPDLSLLAGIAIAGEDAKWGNTYDNEADQREWGAGIQVVWSRPLHFTGQRETVQAAEAALAAARARRRQVTVDVTTAVAVAGERFASGRQRLATAGRAVAAARQTLDAEQRRFRLGEGRSRQVLDAEKDLTTTCRLQYNNAARVLRARADHNYACGYAAR